MKMVRMVLSAAVAAALIALVGVGGRVTAQPTLPDGPNRDLVERTCSACHDTSMLTATGGRSREGWNSTLDDMVSNGLSISPSDRALVLQYLSTYLSAPQ
jgi:hypothetical protein